MRKFALTLAALSLLVFAFSQAHSQGNNQTPAQPVAGAPQNRSTLNGSVTIATGNTFQTVLVAQTPSTIRQELTINNNNATDSCWLFIGSGTAAKATSILLLAGASYRREWPFVPSDAFQATCASNSDTLYIDTQ